VFHEGSKLWVPLRHNFGAKFDAERHTFAAERKVDGLSTIGPRSAQELTPSLSVRRTIFADGAYAGRFKAGPSWSENFLLGGLPQYQLVKSMAEGLAQVENAESVHPALISIEGGWQIGYLLEPLENGWVTVFLPQAPTPMSGNVMYLPVDRVRPLGITMVQAMAIVKRMGVGSAKALSGADLTLPAGA